MKLVPAEELGERTWVPVTVTAVDHAVLATRVSARIADITVAEGARVLLVDDGSVQKAPERWRTEAWGRFQRVDVLELRRNLGHQRALAVGLCHVEANIPCQAVLVMDSDGEDAPADVPRLLDRLKEEGGRRVIFAERTKRSESFAFRFFYALYRWLHLLLTGIAVRVGNFSAMPYAQLRRLVAVSAVWRVP